MPEGCLTGSKEQQRGTELDGKVGRWEVTSLRSNVKGSSIDDEVIEGAKLEMSFFVMFWRTRKGIG